MAEENQRAWPTSPRIGPGPSRSKLPQSRTEPDGNRKEIREGIGSSDDLTGIDRAERRTLVAEQNAEREPSRTCKSKLRKKTKCSAQNTKSKVRDNDKKKNNANQFLIFNIFFKLS